MSSAKIMIIFNILVFCTICTSATDFFNTSTAPMCLGNVCHCENDSSNRIEINQVAVRCNLSHLQDLKNYIKQPEMVHTLNLSFNGLSNIPGGTFSRYFNLVNLSLASNNLASIETDSLLGLVNLRFLDLSKNKLRNVIVSPRGEELQRLEHLDVTGNFNWTPTVSVLSLPALKIIRGATLNGECSVCSLNKNNSHPKFGLSKLKKGIFLIGKEGDCRGTEYRVGNLTTVFATYGFLPSCLEDDEKCYKSEIVEIPFHRCWETDNHIFNVLFVFGIVGLILNAGVVLITLTEAKLRTKSVMLIISSLAVSDFIIETYSISLASARKRPYIDFLDILEPFCQFAGFIWMVGIFVTITSSVLLTVERYLTIVYCMRPSAHMNRKSTFSLILISWLLAFIIAILPYFDIGTYTGNTLCLPLVPSRANPHSAQFSVAITLVGIVLYLTMIPLYIHIYVFVRRSSHRTGIKREGTVAMRIALLVGSNMVFFFLPVFIVLLYLTTNITKGMTPVEKEALTGAAGTVCTSVNSFINPLLYAYRNDRFKRVLCHRLAIVRRGTRSLSRSLPGPGPSSRDEINPNGIKKRALVDPSFADPGKISSGSESLEVKELSSPTPVTKYTDGAVDEGLNCGEASV